MLSASRRLIVIFFGILATATALYLTLWNHGLITGLDYLNSFSIQVQSRKHLKVSYSSNFNKYTLSADKLYIQYKLF